MQHKEDLIIIRHGRSEYNIGKAMNLDSPLTDFGQKQAVNVGRYLTEVMGLATKGFGFYTSPFLRCLETAEHIRTRLGRTESVFMSAAGHNLVMKAWNADFKVMSELREYLDYSKSDVMIPARQQYAYDWNSFRVDGEKYGTEHNAVFLSRMQAAFEKLPSRSVVVTHGLPGLALMHVATTPSPAEIPVWDGSLDNCSITWIHKGRVMLKGKNLHHEVEGGNPWTNDDWVMNVLR